MTGLAHFNNKTDFRKRKRVYSKQNGSATYFNKTGGAFFSTILIGMPFGSLGTRLGRVGIAWDDFYFMDQE